MYVMSNSRHVSFIYIAHLNTTGVDSKRFTWQKRKEQVKVNKNVCLMLCMVVYMLCCIVVLTDSRYVCINGSRFVWCLSMFITRLFSMLWNAPFTCMGLPNCIGVSGCILFGFGSY